MKRFKFSVIIIIILVSNAWITNHAFSASQGVLSEIEEKSKQIQELEKQIQNLENQISKKRGESRTLENEVSQLDSRVKSIQLEIRKLQLSIGQMNDEITETNGKIKESEETIDKQKLALAQIIKVLSRNDNENLTQIIFKYDSISDFFSYLNNIQNTQDNLRISIQKIRNVKIELEETKEELSNKKFELERLRSFQEIERSSLNGAKKEKDRLLKETKGQESKFQKLIQQSKFDIEKIREQVTFLQQNGISVEDAVKFAQLAAIRVGIRPGFLLAILEVESEMGKRVGTGNWLDDMYNCYLRLRKPQRAETEKNAFFAIISKLGLDPNSVKVSREPNYGCGGAMGPAQFIPSTWLAYEGEVARLTGHNPPNPWSIEDSFMASAIKLARGGANTKTAQGEIRASKSYISGNPNCSSSICKYYSNTVQRKADQIEASL